MSLYNFNKGEQKRLPFFHFFFFFIVVPFNITHAYAARQSMNSSRCIRSVFIRWMIIPIAYLILEQRNKPSHIPF